MARYGPFVVCASLALFLRPLTLTAEPPAKDADAAFRNSLAVQSAMDQARGWLFQKGDAQKAVEILEANLARINGNTAYLQLLRDAYRAYLAQLAHRQQTALFDKYRERLAILDPDAARMLTLQPVSQTAAGDTKPPGRPELATKPVDKAKIPGLALLQQLTPPKLSLPGSKAAPTIRAKLDDDDPFGLANKRLPKTDDRQQRARGLLAQADAEFGQRHYGQARVLYEQAHKTEPGVVGASIPRWAYCKLSNVVDQLNQPKQGNSSLSDLECEIQVALSMAPSLATEGKKLLREIDDRRRTGGQSSPAALRADFSVKHVGRVQGWQLAETPHFRIFHHQSAEFAEKAARIAEQTRLDMYRKWFGNDGPEWTPKCDLYLHANGQEYTRATGVPSQSPGHSRFDSENSGRVIGRRMDLHCDVPTMLDAVLPHETTHVVLAGQFGRHQVPRWADEGMAVLTEPREKIDQHRRNMARSHQEGQLFNVRELMHLQDYPQARRVPVFYAQSVVLVDFLTSLRGPRVFADFLRDGLNGGYEQALAKHYGIRDFNDLQARWNRQVLAEINRFSPGVAGR
jgi:hypothetical protein